MTAERRRLMSVHLAAAATSVAILTCGPAMAQSTGNRLPGLDVSDWQGTINWSTVYNSGGKRFAFIRSSRGGTTGTYDEVARTGTLSQRYDDLTFVTNITNATNAGLYVGPYHFARPDIVTNTGADEANHFLQQAGNWMRPGYLLPVLDAEAGQSQRSSANLSQFYIDFANRIKQVVGVAPIIYINQNYANYVTAEVAAVMPNNWEARWNGQGTTGYDWRQVPWNTGDPAPSPSTANVYGRWNPDYPAIPNSTPWPGEQPWKFWQYTSVGRVPGIGGGNANVDLDAVHGTVEYLKDFLVPALWTSSASGDWSAVANWNSDNPNYVAGNNATGPAPRLPGPDDTVILNDALSSGSYTVTLSSGTQTIRKLYVQRPLNITGGSLAVGYVPSVDSTPISAQFSQAVSMSGGALSVHTLLVDAGRTFTLSGGALTLDTLTLTAGTTPAKLLVNGNVALNPLNDAAAAIESSSGTNSATLDLGGATRTLTVGDGSAAVDLTLDLPVTNGSITKAGAGTLQLNQPATLNAPVTVSAGTLVATRDNQLGTGVSLAAGGSLHLAGSRSYALPLTIGGAGAGGIPGASGTPASPGGPGALHALSGNSTWSGPVTLAGTGANGTDPLINQVSADAGATLTLSGVVSSTANGALAKSGAGDLVLTGSAPNTYTGLTRLYGGRIVVEKDGALGSPDLHTFMLAGSASTLAFRAPASSPAGFTYAAQEVIHTDGAGAPGFGQVDNLSGNNTFAGSIAVAGPANVGSIGVSVGTLTIAGGLYSRSGASSRTINKLGPGTLVLTGDSSLASGSSLAVPLTGSTLNVTAGTVDLRSPFATAANVPGLSTYSVSAGATLLNTTGTLTDAALSVAGTFRQAAGARIQGASLVVLPGGVATFDASPDAAPSVLTSLSLVATSQLDLTDGALVIDYADDATSPTNFIRQRLLTGRASGYWTGTGLVSSAAADDPLLRTAIGYAEAAAMGADDFLGASVDPTSLLLQYTWYGDANLDGTVDADDYALIDRGFARGMTGWTGGDFDYDGTVGPADYLLIDRVFAQTHGGTLAADLLTRREAQFGPAYVASLIAAIPEPTGLAAGLTVVLPFLTRRRIPGR
jgi:autotransporter-associated beta strand protein